MNALAINVHFFSFFQILSSEFEMYVCTEGGLQIGVSDFSAQNGNEQRTFYASNMSSKYTYFNSIRKNMAFWIFVSSSFCLSL